MTTASYGSWASAASALASGWASRQVQKWDQRVAQTQYTYQRTIAAANNRLLDAQAVGANELRAGNNRLLAAQAKAENTLRAINNKRQLIRGQEAHQVATENFARGQEAAIAGSVEQQVAAAEQRGAYAASAALSGTSGSTLEMIETTLALKQQRAAEWQDRQQGYASYDQLRQIAGIIPNAISSRDTSTTVAAQDHGITFSQAQSLGPETMAQPNIAGNFFTDLWSWSQRNDDGFRQLGASAASWFNKTPATAGYVSLAEGSG